MELMMKTKIIFVVASMLIVIMLNSTVWGDDPVESHDQRNQKKEKIEKRLAEIKSLRENMKTTINNKDLSVHVLFDNTIKEKAVIAGYRFGKDIPVDLQNKIRTLTSLMNDTLLWKQRREKFLQNFTNPENAGIDTLLIEKIYKPNK